MRRMHVSYWYVGKSHPYQSFPPDTGYGACWADISGPLTLARLEEVRQKIIKDNNHAAAVILSFTWLEESPDEAVPSGAGEGPGEAGRGTGGAGGS